MSSLSKNGQISIVILLVAIVVVGLLVFFFAQKQIFSPPVEDRSQLVTTYVNSCLESTLEGAVVYVGRHGGFYYAPKPVVEAENEVLPYYVPGNVPPLQTFESGISDYIKVYLPDCLHDFVVFEDQGYDVTKGPFQVSTTILDTQVKTTVTYPVVFRKGSSTFRLETFSATVDSGLAVLRAAAAEFCAQQSTLFCESCLSATVHKYDLHAEVTSWKNDTLVLLMNNNDEALGFAIRPEGVA